MPSTTERRKAILQLLEHANHPIAARTLANQFSVSRQVIVQDMAVIRAGQPNIISTTRGYVLQSPTTAYKQEFKVRHMPERTEEELTLIIDLGGTVTNVSISHRVYGRLTAEMDLHSRQDIREFLTAFEGSSSSMLSTTTNGYHYHLVEAPTPERLEAIRQALDDAGFLVPLQPWEV